MEYIELVIKIPKSYYELVLKRCKDPVLLNAFKNSTPLPKGHDKLIDVSNLLTVTDYDGENEKTYVLYNEIKHAPTVIEADKGSENE